MYSSSQSRIGSYTQKLNVVQWAHTIKPSANSCKDKQMFESVASPAGHITRFHTSVQSPGSSVMTMPATRFRRCEARAMGPAAGSFIPNRDGALGRGIVSLCTGPTESLVIDHRERRQLGRESAREAYIIAGAPGVRLAARAMRVQRGVPSMPL